MTVLHGSMRKLASSEFALRLDLNQSTFVMLSARNMYMHADAYRKAVDLNGRDYRAWYGLGQTYELLHMPFYALHYYRQATQLRPHDARMWCVQPPLVMYCRA